ncbi:PadR family transcriptional regulator [Rubrobacter aplysinae]|uniref:PadR family transcriptional regulator n=1 Tax=Rubrobacter aplysinae TaxID=909625 RepID=UPI00064BD8EB|nr:helix-turn-helix transcriptional regulator [Rubrobacter aplysinae]
MSRERDPRHGPQESPSLSPAVFDILLALSDGEERHGYGIAREVESRTGGGVKLGPGTLYGAIKRMISQGLIVEAEEQEDGRSEGSGHEERRRYYRITGTGRQAASMEAQRLESLVSTARSRGLLPNTAPTPEEG